MLFFKKCANFTPQIEMYMATEEVLFPSLYEENYILRSLGSIVTQPDIALTELIANAWDAGASTVGIVV